MSSQSVEHMTPMIILILFVLLGSKRRRLRNAGELSKHRACFLRHCKYSRHERKVCVARGRHWNQFTFVPVGERLTGTIQIKSTEAFPSCGSIRCDHREYECCAFPWASLQKVTLKLRYSIKRATKTRNLFCDFAPNELNSDFAGFTTQ